ncbi:MAG: hypothetical protein JW966_03405, partial [Anaerolineae bacterium]|nr:hypothetical protein [Anaerolineae bacterium]
RQRAGRLAGVIAALCYVYSPYIVYREPHVRGAYPELLAFTIFPFVMWRFACVLIDERARNVVLAAVSVGVLIISHNLMSLVLFGMLCAWLAWNWVARLVDWRRLALAAVAAGFGVGLAAYFWLPVMLERDEVQLENLTGIPSLDYRNAFVEFDELLALSDRTDAALFSGLNAQNNLGVMQWVLGLGGFAVALFLNTRLGHAVRQRRATVADIPVSTSYGVFWVLVMAVLVGLMVDSSEPIWDAVSVIGYMQFPWRLLGPAAFALAALVGTNMVWIERLPARWGGALAAGIVAAVVVQASPLFFIADSWRTGPVDTSVAGYHAVEVPSLLPYGATVTNEFLSKYVFVIPSPTQRLLDDYADGYPVNKLNLDGLPDSVDVDLIDHGPQHDEWRISTPESRRIEVLTFYFDGWRATIDGDEVDIVPSEPHGLITFEVPAGEHTVRLELTRTPVRWTGLGISVVALFGLVAFGGGLWYWTRRSRPRVEPEPGSLPAGALKPAWGWGMLGGAALAVVLLAIVMHEGRAWVHSEPGEAKLADVQVQYTFGNDIQLIGYDISADTLKPGERLKLWLYWYVRGQPDKDYRSFIHLSTWGPPLAQADKFYPAGTATTNWPPGALLRDEYTIVLPDAMPPDVYNLIVGLWTCDGMPEGECGNGIRLDVTDGDGDPVGDSVQLQTVRVR